MPDEELFIQLRENRLNTMPRIGKDIKRFTKENINICHFISEFIYLLWSHDKYLFTHALE